MATRLIYKFHKWTAVIVGVLTLTWFVSGAVLALPETRRSLSPEISTSPREEAALPGAPEFDAARISPADAIAVVAAHVGRPVHVTGVAIRRLPGYLAFQITTEKHGSHLVDAIAGGVIEVDAALASRIVARFVGNDAALGPATVQEARTLVYNGPLPAYRIAVSNGKGTEFYVDRATGSAQLTDRLSRPLALLARLHTLNFIRSLLPVPLWVFIGILSIIGSTMAITGMTILALQFQRWLGRRSAAGITRPR